ncbi:MAG: DNA internalization-related competence protein ComEC/Rec2 [Firmicutes bacterium]|nr:DNA internalization-related competence protein ComEC/Rec2 [Bacillota bacterium]
MKRLKIVLQSNLFYYLLLILSFIYVFFSTVLISYKSKYTIENKLDGVVLSKKIDGNKVSITFKTNKEKVVGTYYLKTKEEKEYFIDNLKYGSYVNLTGELSDPSNNSIFNTFNYRKYLYNKRIYKIFNISSFNISNNNISLINRFKNFLSDTIDKRDNSEYIKIFILGDKTSIDSDDLNNYQTLGISHLFSVSGMHITLFSCVVLFLLSKLKNKNIPIIISLIVLFIYGLLCSFPSSIKRAYTLYLLLSLNKIFKLDIKTMNLFYLTIVINIIIDCFIIYDIGFLYSSLTTYGLIKFNNYLKRGNYFYILLKVSIIAFLFSLPITINNNYVINLMSPINNLFVVPLVSLIVYPLSILTLIIPIFNPLFDLSLNLLFIINNFLININIINAVIPKIPLLVIFIYYIFLVLSYRYKRMILCYLLLILFVKYNYFLDDSSYVYFFDVQQGDSALVVSPRHKNVTLIDTGGLVKFKEEKWKKKNKEYHLSDNTISFMHSIGISRINNLVISHGDQDHVGEAINIINNIKVERVIFNCGPYNNLEKELIKVLDKKNIKYNTCINKLEDMLFLQTKVYDNENDNSNVIYAELSGYKFMFMGDASVTTEKEILNKYNLPDIDVLKVGHHGSKTSSSKEFINEINQKYSIISVGKNNRYGHPNKEVLNTLNHSKIYRTDEDGSIMFKIKNNKLKIDTCIP